jgi:hypothetical protein
MTSVTVDVDVCEFVEDNLDEVLQEIDTHALECELLKRGRMVYDGDSLEGAFWKLIERGVPEECHRELDEWLLRKTCRVVKGVAS